MKTQAIKYLNSLITDETKKSEIDLIEFCKKCVREFKEEKEPQQKIDLSPYFETLWKHYPRKTNKQTARRTFAKLFKGLNEQQVKDKANKIWTLQKRYAQECLDQNREMQYICHYSTWLNANVPAK